MKKTTKTLVLVLSAWILSRSVLVFFIWNHFQYKYNTPIEISGNAIEGYYGGVNLVRIGDALYYSYCKNEWNHGLIKITEEGVDRIYWKGFELKGCTGYPFFSYQNQLMMTFRENSVYRSKIYDEESNSFVETSSFPDLHFDITNTRAQEDENGLYFLDPESKSVVLYQNGQLSTVLDGNNERIDWFQVQGDSIIYKTYDKAFPFQNQAPVSYVHYWRYDLSSQKKTKIISFEKEKDWISIVHWYQDILILKDNNKIWTMDLSNPENIQVVVDSNCEKLTVYNGVLYYYDGEGLYSYRLEDGQTQLLCKKEIQQIYIVDDRWIYLEGEDGSLWRIEQNGTNLQLLCKKEIQQIYIVDDQWIYLEEEDDSLWRIEQDGTNLQHVFG